jgi:subtilase family serine protease
VDSFGSPTISSDLATFDSTFGLAAPPSLQILQPAGAVPPFDPTNDDKLGWAGETSLDVEYAHAMAPGASSTGLPCSASRSRPGQTAIRW